MFQRKAGTEEKAESEEADENSGMRDAHFLAFGLTLLLSGCGSRESPKSATPDYSIPKEITLNAFAVRDASGAILIEGRTNLPDGVKLGIELLNGKIPTHQDFDVFVSSGVFRSRGATNHGRPIHQGKHTVHVFTLFTEVWQTPRVLSLVGRGGSKLPRSALIRSEDVQLIDADNVLEYIAELTFPPLVAAQKTKQLPPSPGHDSAIQLVKSAILVVDGSRSSMTVEDGFRFYTKSPGVSMGDGWSAAPSGKRQQVYDVTLDFIDGILGHSKAIWQADLSTNKVIYRNKSAKAFSWIPKD